MPNDLKTKYGTSQTIACTVASLASSSTRVAGRESDAVDNTSNLYDDALLSGKVTTGTSPTASRQIDIWIYSDDGNNNYPSGFTGSDSAETVASATFRNAALRLAQSIIVDVTDNRTYHFANISIAALFGGAMPRKWGVWVVQDTGADLHATGSNHEFRYVGVHYQSVAA